MEGEIIIVTETQKKFKKEMEDFQSTIELNPKNRSSYSYIERDVIESYYDRKTRRKKIAINIGVGSIIMVLLGVFSIYIEFKPIVDLVSKAQAPRLSTMLPGNEVLHTEIVESINKIDYQLAYLYELINDSNLNVTPYINDSKKSIQLKDKLSTHIGAIDSLVLNIKDLKIHKYMEKYRDISLEMLQSTKDIANLKIKYINSNEVAIKNDYILQLQQLRDKFNLSIIQQREELIKVFDMTGITYTIKDGNISFTYKSYK